VLHNIHTPLPECHNSFPPSPCVTIHRPLLLLLTGLLRTVLEAQETRGLTRSDDISRMLPAEAAHLSRGRTVSPKMRVSVLFGACFKMLECSETFRCYKVQ